MIVGEPKLRRQRIVLFRTDSRRGKLVSAVSPLAIQDEIRVDMPLSETQSLLKRSDGEFYVLEHHPADDLEALKELADSLEKFSPLVGLETVEPADQKRVRSERIRDDRSQWPDSILLDVTGLDQLFGGEKPIGRSTSTALPATGLCAPHRDRQYGRGRLGSREILTPSQNRSNPFVGNHHFAR